MLLLSLSRLSRFLCMRFRDIFFRFCDKAFFRRCDFCCLQQENQLKKTRVSFYVVAWAMGKSTALIINSVTRDFTQFVSSSHSF